MPHCEGSVPDQKLGGMRKGRSRPVNQPTEFGYPEVAPQNLWNLLIHKRLSAPWAKEEQLAIVSHTGT